MLYAPAVQILSTHEEAPERGFLFAAIPLVD